MPERKANTSISRSSKINSKLHCYKKKKYPKSVVTEGSDIETTLEIRHPESHLPKRTEVKVENIKNCPTIETSNRSEINPTNSTDKPPTIHIALGISVPLVMVICCTLIVVLLRKRSKRRHREEQKQDDDNPVYGVYYFAL